MLIVGNLEELQNLVNRVKSQIEKAGLVLDIKKMKMRKSQRSPLENGSEIDRCNFENINWLTYLGLTFFNNIEDSTQVTRSGITKNTTIALNNVGKNRGNTLTIKMRLLKTTVFIVISYG